MPIATDFMKALHMQLDLNFKQDRVKGAIFIYDFENLTMPFVILQLTVLKKALEVGLVSFPITFSENIVRGSLFGIYLRKIFFLHLKKTGNLFNAINFIKIEVRNK